MSNLIEQIKTSILTSNQLLEKCKNFDIFLKKHQGKDYDDFSFTVKDSFEITIKSFKGEYKNDVIVTDNSFDEYLFFDFIRSSLEELKFESSELDFALSLGLLNKYNLEVLFNFRIKYSNENDSFGMQKIISCEVHYSKQELKNYFRVSSSEDQELLGFVETEKEALLVLEKLNEVKSHFQDLNSRVKNELYDVIYDCRRIYGSYKEEGVTFSSLRKTLANVLGTDNFVLSDSNNIATEAVQFIELWLDKNCMSEYRNLIKADKYNIHFSDREPWWLIPVSYLSEDTTIMIDAPKTL